MSGPVDACTDTAPSGSTARNITPPCGVPFPSGRLHGSGLRLGFPPPCRVSQVPGLIFPRALSPTTRQARRVLTYGFPVDIRLHLLWQTGHLHFASRGRIRFACATARRFAAPVSTRWLLNLAPDSLHVRMSNLHNEHLSVHKINPGLAWCTEGPQRS